MNATCLDATANGMRTVLHMSPASAGRSGASPRRNVTIVSLREVGWTAPLRQPHRRRPSERARRPGRCSPPTSSRRWPAVPRRCLRGRWALLYEHVLLERARPMAPASDPTSEARFEDCASPAATPPTFRLCPQGCERRGRDWSQAVFIL